MQKIDEGPAGVKNCIWAPDGCSILVVADFQIRISVYSLLDKSVKTMTGPKYPDRGISFSPDGELLAYAEVQVQAKLLIKVLKLSRSWG